MQINLELTVKELLFLCEAVQYARQHGARFRVPEAEATLSRKVGEAVAQVKQKLE
jgi:hypothetical protein